MARPQAQSHGSGVSGVVNEQPAMVKIDAQNKLTIRRETIEEQIGRPYDLQELQVNLITISGNLDQTDDEMVLYWNA